MRGTKINQLQAVVAKVAVVMCLDVASPAIRCLELPLNDEIGAIQPRRISGVIAGIFGLERKLVIVTCFSRGDVFCVKSHETSFPGLPRDHSRRSNPYRPAPAASRGFLRRGLSDTSRPLGSAQSVFGRPPIILNECDGSGQPIRLPLLWVEAVRKRTRASSARNKGTHLRVNPQRSFAQGACRIRFMLVAVTARRFHTAWVESGSLPIHRTVSKHRRHLAAHFWRLYRLSEEHTLIPGLLTPACFLPAERGIHHEIFRHLLVGIQAHLAIATPRRLLLGECHKCAADAASM